MSLETRILALSAAIGADVKSLIAADAELRALIASVQSGNTADTAALEARLRTLIEGQAQYTNDRIQVVRQEMADAGAIARSVMEQADNQIRADLAGYIQNGLAELRNQLINGAGEALDTLKELADALGNDPTFAATITTALGNRVRVDEAQTFTTDQQATGRSNIGAAAKADVDALTLAVGNADADFAAAYAAAKAAV